ncbi:MAG: efflux RND transporter periplasmic adaptor subunit [Candidatus Gracilibacteria bacterium]|nr:efflux RND transporter periplasmic adaptor subunit [Candidatus Gracilibacteria bacterium]
MKKILLSIFILSLFATTSCTKQEVKQVQKFYSTGTVQTGSVDSKESYIGYAHGITEVTLATQSNGKVTYLKSKVGDKVNAGDLLASLDSLDAKVGYNTASNIMGSLDLLKNFTGLSYDEQIKVLEKKIEEIEQTSKSVDNNTNNLENLKNTELVSGELNVKQAQTQLETAKNELEQTTNIYNGKKQDLYKSGKNVITNYFILSTNIINFSDEILGVTEKNKDKNNSYQDYLGAKNSQTLNQSKENFRQANNLFLEYKTFYETKIENKSPTDEDIKAGLDNGLKLAEITKALLNSLYKTIDNSIENTYLNSDTLNNFREKVSSYGTQLESSIMSVNGSFMVGLRATPESLASLDREYNMQKVLLEKKIDLQLDNLETAKQNLIRIKASSNVTTSQELSKKDIYQKQIEGIQAQIESIKSDKNAKIKELDSSIIEVQGQKSLAGVQIQNGNITSPISGIVLEKFSEVGQITSAGNPVYIVGDDSKIKVNIDVITEKLNNFQVGKSVNIQFEGVDKIMNGIVTNIPVFRDELTKKTTIEIIVDNSEKLIKIGSIARVNIPNLLDNKTALIIPNIAILQKFSVPGVYVLVQGKAIFTKIEILKQSPDFSEISGLKVGDTIITDGKENVYDGEILQ